MPNCPSDFVFAYEVCRALVDLVQFETGPNNSLPKTLYATNTNLEQGVVHILRNHFWGFRETPPLCNIVIIWAYPPYVIL